ncbi:MAG: N-acetylneuraminate synthase [Candidatus Woesearchaeota archaeon]|nr:N-acetylneuraminate synthase [Candidatus Woesearchaeota archaeon]
MGENIVIEGLGIGEGRPCFIIAEAGVNHNGDIKLAKKLVDAAKRSGVDAVKFQTFRSKNLVTESAEMASYQEKNTGRKESQIKMLRKIELSYPEFEELKRYCDSKGVMFLSTPHTEDAAEFLDKIVPLFKVGSGDLTNIPFLEKLAKKGKPIMLSTGMSTLEEVKEAVDAIKRYNKELILLQCTTNYPCPKKDVNLKVMDTLRKETGCLVGYSDHTEGIGVSVMAAYLGAVVIEKHFTLDRKMKGPDHKASLEPDELQKMVDEIRAIERDKNARKIVVPKIILGNGIKKPTKQELKIMKIARKSIVSAKNIKKGARITEDMIIMKRPGIGIEPNDLAKVLGRTAKKNIKKDELISFDMLS